MKILIFLISIFSFNLFSATSVAKFQSEAKDLAYELKVTMMTQLAEKIKKSNVEEAIPFCHVSVKEIGKEAAGNRIKLFEFGRTSHKLRNKNNTPTDWLNPYLEQFKSTFQKNKKQADIVGELPNGKKFYLEPLYVQAQCLVCHGENIASGVQTKLSELYPEDQATGFKLGEFRGFIWIKQK